MTYTKTLLAITLVGLAAANTASAEWFKEFGDQAYTTENTRRGEAEVFAQSGAVTTDAFDEDRRGRRSPEQPGRHPVGYLPGR